MLKTCISKDWSLTSPNKENVNIDLPNDFSISIPRSSDAPGGGQNGYFVGGVGTYKKYFTLPENDDHILLDIEGAYSQTEVTFNEDLIYQHHHGYTPFLIDLSEKARRGLTNCLSVKVNDLQPSTRWYSGAGLYRDVYLWTGGKVRIEPWDVFVSTVKVKEERAELKISYTITSDITDIAQIIGEITSPDKETEIFTLCADVKPGKNQAEFTVFIDNPMLWDIDSPNLYTIKTTIQINGEDTDTSIDTFGIRTISADVERGFRLNGKTVKLHGGCIHHTHGVLGAADFPSAIERELTKLKSVGFNTIRSAHNPPSKNLLDACDRMGILVMDEAFDMWRTQKNENDYHLWFEYCWSDDIMRMVKHGRNHPCVISYSIGNEILEKKNISNGGKWAQKIADEIRKYDSTKFVTAGVDRPWAKLTPDIPEAYLEYFKGRHPHEKEIFATATAEFCRPLDIVGYNYLYEIYESDHKIYPDRVIWGSETWAITFYDSWMATIKNNYVIGDFCWTCYDNLGESGTGRSLWERDGVVDGISIADYEWISCYQGDFDLAGYRRPQSYYREAIWSDKTVSPRIFTTHPEHYGEGFTGTGWHFYDVHETWTFDEKYIGRPVKVETYTMADEAEWYLNGKLIGKSIPKKAIASIDIPYEKGEISVKIFKDGKECGCASLSTVDAPFTLEIEGDKSVIAADNRELCYFEIAVQDSKGRLVTECGDELICKISGGELMGIFSGDPKSKDHYTSNSCHLFEGHATACVRASEPGDIKLIIKFNGKDYHCSVKAV